MGTVSYVTLENSTFLDLNSFDTNGAAPTGSAYGGSVTINVALVFERANSPADLLDADWATRQKALAALESSGELWSTYGADPDAYQSVLDALHDLGVPIFHDGDAPTNAQYVSSPESRTIWVQLDETSFTTLFGPGAVIRASDHGDFLFWDGNLSLPEQIADAGVKGLWFDGVFEHTVVADPGSGPEATLPIGPQSPGNAAGNSLTPNEIAALYNFPFADEALWTAVKTGAVGFVEPGIGTALPPTSSTFDELLQAYRESVGITTPLSPTVNVAAGGQGYEAGSGGERSLDVGIVTAVNPNSQLVLYAGSGQVHSARASTFTAYQSAIWDTANNPGVLSSSYGSLPNVAPGSPFHFAMDELFVDALLRNVTVVNAIGDGGSGDQYANGLTSVSAINANALTVTVGGTSFSTVTTAGSDSTLETFYKKALAGNLATIWQLVKGGLTVKPSDAPSTAKFIETVWNQYAVYSSHDHKGVIGNVVNDEGGYLVNLTTSGGVDTTQPTPGYQTDYGLTPTTSDPRAATGRGVPDVSANADGNLHYIVPTGDFGISGDGATHESGGTSASAPLWAALISQIDTIFADQKLPRLGYMNDLLYTAAVIAPGSFNDITVGSNTSSFVLGGDYVIKDGNDEIHVTPTGYGYSAGYGYDYVSGLGTPNGVLLARALTAIAHGQMWEDAPAGAKEVLAPQEGGGWKSTVKQGFLVQVSAADDAAVKVKTGNGRIAFDAEAADKFAWTSQFAQQALQEEFDPKLVKMFDGQSQGTLAWKGSKAGVDLKVKVDKHGAEAPQGELSTPYGFVDYVAEGGAAVRIARPVAVAETVGALDDQVAVVRLRQGTEQKVTVEFYRVDDFKGRIDGIAPGEKGYNAAANERAYETLSGKAGIKGPGYGKYKEKKLAGIDSGDIVAMKLKQGGDTYWGFAGANETAHGEHVGHLWNYGLNTWGFESDYKGGDNDFNDLLVQLDFTSAYGSGWLI
jgi:hypothetical protein